MSEFYNSLKISCFRVIVTFACATFLGCESFIDIKPSSTSINSENVFSRDGTALAAVTELYGKLNPWDLRNSFSLALGASADEFVQFGGSTNAYYRNELRTNLNESFGGEFWAYLYQRILSANTSIDGLVASKTLSTSLKQQLLGECYFMRAFCYFYLVNLYGDVPLALTSDPNINNFLPRAPKNHVYDQIVSDLLKAQELLNPAFVNKNRVASADAERILVHRGAATALLARTHLYLGGTHYVAAEAAATEVINQTDLYGLLPLNEVFLKNSKETIWALQPVNNSRNTNTYEGFVFIPPATGPYEGFFMLNSALLQDAELTDDRMVLGNWVNRGTNASGQTYDYAFKYKVQSGSTVTEYGVALRLAEQYLIRAEARAMQGKLTGENSAASDLNMIRARAGLPPTTYTTQAELLDAILQERRVELFTEWGHRWLDLKRTGKIDDVMEVAAGEKGTTWRSFQQWYPIPFTDIQRGLNLKQNEGY